MSTTFNADALETPDSGPAELAAPTQPASLRRAAVRGGVIVLGSRLIIQLFSWAVTIIVARILVPYDYGIVSAASIFFNMADILAEAGVGRALVQKAHLNADDLAEGFTLSLAISLAIYAAIVVIAPAAAMFVRTPELVSVLPVVGIALILTPFRAIPLAILERRLEMGRLSAVGLFSTLVQGVLVLSLAFGGFGFWALLVGSMIPRLVDAFVLVWQAAWLPRLRWPGGWSSPLVTFGLNVSGAKLCSVVFRNADYAIVGRLLGPVALGYYTFAFMLVSLPMDKIVGTCNQITYPIFCRLGNDRQRIRDWYLRLSVMFGSVGTPALVGLALVANDAIPLVLGEKWRPAVLPLQIMSLAGVFMMIAGSIDVLYNALGRPDINLRFTLISVVVYPVLFYLSGRTWGLAGVALVWAIVSPIMVLRLVGCSYSITGFGVRDLLKALIPIWMSAMVMSLPVLACQWFMHGSGRVALSVVVAIGVGVISYTVAIRVFAWKSVMGNLTLLWRELRAHEH